LKLASLGGWLAGIRPGRQHESRRVIAYFVHEDAQPPGAMLVDLANALRVSADQLLGLKTPKEKSPRTARLLKRLQKVEQLSATDQGVVLKLVDGLLERQTRNGR
jgi:hypothetical protein